MPGQCDINFDDGDVVVGYRNATIGAVIMNDSIPFIHVRCHITMAECLAEVLEKLLSSTVELLECTGPS